MSSPKRLETAAHLVELRLRVRLWRNKGDRIALVPTMGALHEGHLAHIRAAKAKAERVVVSIFVNPAQFAPHEDFGRYPRTLAKDRAMFEQKGKTVLISAPDGQKIYPKGLATQVSVEATAAGLESDFRPHFFSGVATVVIKLLLQCDPDFATFGEKDYQK